MSPVVANRFMEGFETRALEWVSLPACEEDTFILWPHTAEDLESFHTHLIAINHSIQFSCEEEERGQLAFLDVRVKKVSTIIATSVYRKPAHTDRYINYSSHHHSTIKARVVLCLRQRADNLITTQSTKNGDTFKIPSRQAVTHTRLHSCNRDTETEKDYGECELK